MKNLSHSWNSSIASLSCDFDKLSFTLPAWSKQPKQEGENVNSLLLLQIFVYGHGLRKHRKQAITS